MEVEQNGEWRFIRTEGEISKDWIEEIMDIKLAFLSETIRNVSAYPCGSPYGRCCHYTVGGTQVVIHPDRICTLRGREFLEQLSRYLTTRPDLKELLGGN